jgi:hypothetical protein
LPLAVFVGVAVLLYFLMRSPQVATETTTAQELATIQAVTTALRGDADGERRQRDAVVVVIFHGRPLAQ